MCVTLNSAAAAGIFSWVVHLIATSVSLPRIPTSLAVVRRFSRSGRPDLPFRPGGPHACADVWEREVDEGTGKTCSWTCGDIIRRSKPALDPIATGDHVSRLMPQCSPCGYPLGTEGLAEPIYPKVQCLADCLPSGKTFGMPFCRVEHGARLEAT